MVIAGVLEEIACHQTTRSVCVLAAVVELGEKRTEKESIASSQALTEILELVLRWKVDLELVPPPQRNPIQVENLRALSALEEQALILAGVEL